MSKIARSQTTNQNTNKTSQIHYIIQNEKLM